MRDFLLRFRNQLLYPIAITAILAHIAPGVCYANAPSPLDISASADAANDGFNINFNNVSINEYIRFVSRILNVNFVFNDADLQFNVTIVSEEPISPRDIFSALVQVLRINNISIVQQGNNYLLTSSKAVSQIPPVVSEETPSAIPPGAPIITRIFRIKNANVNTLAGILRPMVSKAALIEVSTETRQLIITDVTTNVEQVATLLLSLDSPNNPLNVGSYTAKSITPAELITLSQAIITPFAEGNTLIFVPQTDTNTIYIVSTPYLIDRTVALLQELDVPATKVLGQKPISNENIFLYKIQQRPASDLMDGLKEISTELKTTGVPPSKLVEALDNAKWVKESNSLLFIADNDTLTKIKEILTSLDTTVQGPSKTNFFTYKIQYANQDQIKSALNQISDNLKTSPVPDKNLIDAIQGMKWIKESNSLLFTGDDQTLKRLQELLPSFDQPGSLPAKSSFYIYKIQRSNKDQIEASLDQTAENLKAAPIPDKNLIDAIHSEKWIKETNSLIFTGHTDAIERLQQLLPSLDVTSAELALTQPSASTQFLSYKPEYRSGDEIKASLEELGQNLKDAGLADPSFLHVVDTIKWVPSTKTLLFTGDPASLARIQDLIKNIDTPTGSTKKTEIFLYKPKLASQQQLQNALQQLAKTLDLKNPADRNLSKALQQMTWMSDSGSFVFQADAETIDRIKILIASMDSTEGLAAKPQNFYLYPLQSSHGDAVIENLRHVVTNLKGANLPNPSLIDTINNIKWVEGNNSLLITGSQDDIDQVKDLIARFDVAGPVKPHPVVPPGKSSFYIYKPEHRSPQEIEQSLTDIAKDLEASGLIDEELLDTVSTMRFVPSTNSLLFTGTTSALDKIKGLLTTVDVPGGVVTQVQKVAGVTFLIYKIKYASSAQLMSSLKTVAGNLESSNSLDKDLAQAISGMKYIPDTNSILFTGPATGLEKAEALAQKFDTSELKAPEVAPIRENPPSTFVIYNPQYRTGDELISMLCAFEQNLIQSGVSNKGLFDTINNLKWMPETCSLLVSGDDASIAKVQELLLKFDVPLPNANAGPMIEAIENTSFLVYKLQYQLGDEIKKALTQIGTEFTTAHSSANQALYDAINSVQWITVTNSLLASGDQSVLVKLQNLIENLDVPLKQVFIEVLILQTTLLNAQDIGLQWGGRLQLFNKVAAGTGLAPQQNPLSNSPPFNEFSTNFPNINATNTPTPNSTNIPVTGGFDFGVIGDIIMNKGRSFLSLGSLVNAVQTDNDTLVVMNPKIIAQDNSLSTIFVGQNLPFTSSTINTIGGGTTSALSNNIEYRDIGINLSITPTLGNGDIVTLDISTDITNTITSTVQGISGTGIPTSHTNMSTRVHVPNKHFVALSGMLQDTKSHFRSQIPCLGGIPVIGLAFSEVERDDSKSNIIIFVRPQLINSFDEYKQITERQQNLYKDIVVLPVLKEEFDDGIDWVKTPENE